MRLGQLARKLEVRPNQIVDFLATQNIDIDNGSNTRMQPDHVALAIQHFSPGLSVDDVGDNVEAPEEAADASNDVSFNEPTVESQPEAISELPPEKSEIIKAPKIELSGLKVLGKIDLPEVRKKEAEPAEEDVERPKEIKKERRSKEYRRSTPKNPIALQREEAALEARKKREEEGKLQKERRTQNYMKKVKTPPPTKAVRIFNEETQQMSASDLLEPPKTLWGKLVKWLTT